MLGERSTTGLCLPHNLRGFEKVKYIKTGSCADRGLSLEEGVSTKDKS